MLLRTFSVGRATREKQDGDLLVEMAFASEVPYKRWWGVEVLDCSEAAVRMGRLNDGAPLLYNHNWDDLRGTHVAGSVRCDPDKVMRGTVRVESVTQTGRDTAALVESGILVKSSVGYQIHRVIEQTKTKAGERIEREIDGAVFERVIERFADQRAGDIVAFRRAIDAAAGPIERAEDEETIYRIVDWEPLENSLVTIPADNGVGVNRSHGFQQTIASPAPAAAGAEVSQPAAPAASQEHRHMTTAVDTPAAGPQAAPQAPSALQAERERRQAIIDLCKVNKIDARVEARWIEDGTPLTEVAKQLLDVMEERGKAKPTAASALGLSSKETQQYSLFRAIRAMAYGGRNPQYIAEAAFEMECSRAVAKQVGRGDSANILIPGEVLTKPMSHEAMTRAMATKPGASGGYLVDTTNMGFIDILRNRSVCYAMGARRLDGLVGNVSFARQTGSPTVTWQGGEHVSVTAADQTLGQLSMTPKTAIVVTDVSEQLLRQASPSAEEFVMADLAADVAIGGVDCAAINGTGGAQPIGIKNTTGITSGQDASSATYAKILGFPGAAAAANAIRGRPGFVTNAAGAIVLMQKYRVANTDTPLWEGNIMDGRCVGFPAMSSEQLASANLIFGSWDELVIGSWGVLELAMDSGGTRFNTATVGIRAMWMVDVMLRYPQAFVVSTNLGA
jgi:HK97 family phage major capsid protein